MHPLVLAVLRSFHVVAGGFWLGAVLYNAAFLLPATRAAGPAGGQVMKEIVQVRRLPRFMNGAVLITLLTGLALFWWASSGFTGAWFTTGVGIGWSLGGGFAIATALLGQLVNAPTARKFGALAASAQAAGGPPAPETLVEMQRLQMRLYRATVLGAVLLVFATSFMAAARYL